MRPAIPVAPRRVVLFLVALSWAAPAAAAGDADKGRKIAEIDCARCHVIGDFNRRGGIGSTPSFPGLKHLDDWRDRFRTFYGRPPHIAYIQIEGIAQPRNLPDYAAKLKLTLDDTEDLFAFVETIPAR
jgi:mono/diheme cytochrome c family protein